MQLANFIENFGMLKYKKSALWQALEVTSDPLSRLKWHLTPRNPLCCLKYAKHLTNCKKLQK